MKAICIQMDMTFGAVDENFRRAGELCRRAMAAQPDVLVLPETWTTGFFPKENLSALCDCGGERVRREMGGLARELGVNIVAGSAPNRKDGGIFNTALVFDRAGQCIAEYDKAHLFSPMGEDRYFAKGEKNAVFSLDGIRCGLEICYDIRFPEWTRTMTAAKPLDCLFLVSQWPDVRMTHLRTLGAARAIENQMFLICCNSCGTAGDTRYGGGSFAVSPWGELLGSAGDREELLEISPDPGILEPIRSSINVFADRRSELYKL